MVKNAGKKTVLVGGCFDLLHYGHLTFLKKAKEQGDYLVVAVESDEFIKKKKKKEPIHNQNQRAEILASIIFVDLVVKLPYFPSDKEYYQLVEKINPSVIAVTKGDPQLQNKKKQAEKIGSRVEVVTSLLDPFSSKNIIRKLKGLI